MVKEHKQVKIYPPFDDSYISIDEEIKDLIAALWAAGIDTYNSCQDNPPGFIWLDLGPVDNAEIFINRIRRPLNKLPVNYADWLYSRIGGGEGKHLKPWQHTAFIADSGFIEGDEYISKPPYFYCLDVRFPQEDYREILRLLSE